MSKMDRVQLINEMRDVLRNIDGHNDAVIDACTEESLLSEDLGLNSIGMLYVMIVLEEKYGISFENCHMEDFKTLGQVMDFIEKES